MSTLSVVISAFNEEKKLEACLSSVKAIADEIIVVNNSSTDDTEKIALRYTKNVFTRPNNPMLNVNKNFGFTKATSDWILCLDADERVTPELAKEMKQIMDAPSDNNGYWIPRKNIIFGKAIENSIWWPDYQMRLFKKGKGKFAEKHVHEMITIDGKTEHLTSPMLHENYSSISQYLQKLDRIYTENEAEQYIANGKTITWIDALRFPADDFFKTFFLRKGYKDGLHGLVLSMLQAFYAEIVFAKIWEKQGFKEYNSKNFLQDVFKECLKIAMEFQYWFVSMFIEITANPAKKLALKMKRKMISQKISS